MNNNNFFSRERNDLKKMTWYSHWTVFVPKRNDWSSHEKHPQQHSILDLDVILAPVVQTLDSAIHKIKIYPVDNAIIGFP